MAKRRKRAGLAAEIARLYALPLDQFTEARNEAAKRLRADGERGDADAVKALRKPSLPAWAINQAARDEPRAVKRLIAAGERLAAAQQAAMAGEQGARDELRAAMAGQSEAVEAMTRAVDAVLGAATGGSNLDRARETLRAVAGDDELGAEIAAGRLARDREAVGFGGLAPPPAKRRAKAAAAEPDAGAKRELEQARRKAKQVQGRAQRALEAAAGRARQAERRRDSARERLDAAEQVLAEAETERREREAELADAESAAGELGIQGRVRR